MSNNYDESDDCLVAIFCDLTIALDCEEIQTLWFRHKGRTFRLDLNIFSMKTVCSGTAHRCVSKRDWISTFFIKKTIYSVTAHWCVMKIKFHMLTYIGADFDFGFKWKFVTFFITQQLVEILQSGIVRLQLVLNTKIFAECQSIGRFNQNVRC